MDSLTQAVLGAGIAGAVAPAGHRSKALLLGAVLGTLPDLDVVIDYGDAVSNFTKHRGFSHSLFVLPPVSVLLWLLLRRWWAPVRDAPLRWLAVVTLALVTHPLLDAHTAYGTQLFWPLTSPPISWATIFIIDPLFTLPLVVGCLYAAFAPRRKSAGTVLKTSLAICCAYLAWTWTAQGIVERDTREMLATRGLTNAPLFVTPTPFNSLLWRIVVMTDDGYLEGFDSLLVDAAPLRLRFYPSDVAALEAARHVPAVPRLRWFARGFIMGQVVNDQLVVSDLRMGFEPTYVFSHVVAERGNPHWHAVPPLLLEVSYGDRSRVGAALRETWRRIWSDAVD